MNIAPLADHVVVKLVKREEKVTSSGIIIPDTADEDLQKGEVLAVGPGRRIENGEVYPVAVKKGDIVVFSKHSPRKMSVDNKDVLFIDESDILTTL